MKYLIFLLQWILATVLEHLGNDWIVYLYKLIYYKVFLIYHLAGMNYYISQKERLKVHQFQVITRW